MKTFVKIFLLIIATGCIFAGLDKINHTYEIAEQRYDKYISELPKGDDEININIPSEVEKYYISTSIKEIITIYICVLSFGLILLLVLIVDFIKWVNTWEKE